MPSGRERSPQERETLIFSSPEKAREFAERVDDSSRQEKVRGVKRRREIVADAVSDEFVKQGEAVNVYSQPWEHNKEEHKEAQELVDEAFEKDLLVAIKKAQKSQGYPRNLDLFHDVLIGEMYELLMERGLNRQRAGNKIIVLWIATIGVLVITFLLVWLF
jgi:hypothetical protein